MTNIEHCIEYREYYIVVWHEGQAISQDYDHISELAAKVHGTVNGPLTLPVAVPVVQGEIVDD